MTFEIFFCSFRFALVECVKCYVIFVPRQIQRAHTHSHKHERLRMNDENKVFAQ